MKKNFTFLITLLMLVSGVAYGQIRVGGVVTSPDGEGLPGATILVKESGQGTVTDIDGNYQLSVDNTATLIFSSTGFINQEIQVKNRTAIDVQLEENVVGLDEVVVIAYGETEKRKFTGSLATVSAAELDQIPQTSPIQMIQGRAAGVLVEDNSGAPGSVGSMVIRGVGSFGGDTDPLYVIDGIPTANFQSFNPNDIESISILKDASATSIYGSRASNGVVLITTKKGKVGKTRITFNAQAGFSDIENPNDFRLMNSTEYTEYYREAFSNAGLDADFQMPAESDSINTDWLDGVLRNGQTQLYEITASGGSEKATHYVSASYFRQKGTVIGTGFERYTGRTNLKLAPVDKLTLDIGILGSFAKNDLQFANRGRSGVYSGAFNVAPTASPFASASTPLNLSGLGYNFDLPSNAGHNPFGAEAMNSRERQTYRAFPTLKVQVEPVQNLILTTSASVDFEVQKESAFQSKYYFAETDNGLAEDLSSYGLANNISATLQYKLELGNNHVISPMIGTERFRSSFQSESSESRDFGFDGIPVVGAGAILSDISSDYGAHTMVSVFSRINYAFQDKLFVDLTYRTDGSSRFGSNNRWGNFYGIGAGYDLTNESFMKGQSFFNSLRLRASYGNQGSYDIDDYRWRNTYNGNGAFIVPGGGNPGSQPESPGNQSLHGRKAYLLTLDLDFALLQK